MRFLITLLLIITFVQAETSQSFCNGKYTNTGTMVDSAFSRFETLYSGGLHWQSVSNVGATIDLYRLWRGLSDLEFRKKNYGYYNLYFYDRFDPDNKNKFSKDEVIRSTLWAGEASHTNYSGKEPYETAVHLDFLTVIDEPINWWLKQDYYNEDTPWQNSLAKITKESNFLNWLQFAATASNAPWSLAWHLEGNIVASKEYLELRDSAFKKYEETNGIEWLVMAMLFYDPKESYFPPSLGAYRFKTRDKRNTYKSLQKHYLRWQHNVLTCTATQKEYAAWASVTPTFYISKNEREQRYDEIFSKLQIEYDETINPYETLNFYQALPFNIRRKLIQNLAWMTFYDGRFNHYYEGDGPDLDMIYLMAQEDIWLRSWLNVARSYLSPSIEALVKTNQSDTLNAKTVRFLNILSTENLNYFLEHTHFDQSSELNLVTAIFARNVILGNIPEASLLIDKLKDTLPEKREYIEEIMEKTVPLDIKLTMILLDQRWSTWIKYGNQYDAIDHDAAIWVQNNLNRSEMIPQDLICEMGIKNDLSTWLRLPSYWYRFRGMRGFSVEAIERIDQSYQLFKYTENSYATYVQRDPLRSPSMNLIRSVNCHYNSLLASEEERNLLDHHRNDILNARIIKWVKQEQSHWLKRFLNNHDASIPQYLHIVVMRGGHYEGKSLGREAYILLHKFFGKSKWAQKTPYWY